VTYCNIAKFHTTTTAKLINRKKLCEINQKLRNAAFTDSIEISQHTLNVNGYVVSLDVREHQSTPVNYVWPTALCSQVLNLFTMLKLSSAVAVNTCIVAKSQDTVDVWEHVSRHKYKSVDHNFKLLAVWNCAQFSSPKLQYYSDVSAPLSKLLVHKCIVCIWLAMRV